MLEVARILAGISVISLILAMAGGTGPLARQRLKGLAGSSAVDDRNLQMAVYMLMSAVGLSGIAAVLAITAFAT
jgi:hypothetical protein